MKLYASIGLVILVGVVGLGFRAAAFQSDKGAANVFENVESLTLNNSSQQEAPVLGALAGPEISSPYLSVNGVTEWFGSVTMKTATTTVCAIQSPAVTSTLTYASAVWDVSSSTASISVMAKGADAFSTTTIIGTNYQMGANVKGFMVASSTAFTSGANIFAPSQYLVLSMQGGSGTFSPTGYCKARFVSAY